MSKHEAPPFKMLVEDGRLVPAAAWDQERLATYRNRSAVTVRITQEKNRKLERKYWAILHRVVATCGLKQRTAEDLHKAIRLKLGIVDAFFTMDGKLRVEIKSTTGMEDAEYSAFYEEAMALLFKETGVDPETLQLESADVGEDEPQSSGAAPASPAEMSDEAATLIPDPSGVAATSHSDGEFDSSNDAGAPDESGSAEPDLGAAATPSADAADQGAGEVNGLSASPAAELVTHNLMVECMDKFLQVATDPKVPDPKDRRGNVVFAKNAWKDELKGRQDFVKACFETADQVVKGLKTPEDARTHLEGLVAA